MFSDFSIGKKFFLETYGCQMNFSDSEIVASVMNKAGYQITDEIGKSDVVLINTCSIRDHAEQRVRNRLGELKSLKRKKPGMIVGLLGCMAERMKTQLLEEEKIVDVIAGPDSYRDLPALVMNSSVKKGVNVLLSREETYADISPVRLHGNGVSAFISIMRGCDNMCSFCVVPFTRGRERSREPLTIINEAKELFKNGYREITLLGQNVDSYLWNENVSFSQLLEMVAQVNPLLRIRFSTSHPKDMTDEVLHIMRKYDTVCKYIHLPVQSGSDNVLGKMNRGYTRNWYMERIQSIRKIIPECGISTDIITGFCEETEDDHRQTLSLMEEAGFDFAYMFKYSERPGTPAARKYKDDVPDALKTKRLQEVIALQQELSLRSNKKSIGKTHRVLAEGLSKRSKKHLSGRNTQNVTVVFPKGGFKPGEYVDVKVTECTAATLLGQIL